MTNISIITDNLYSSKSPAKMSNNTFYTNLNNIAREKVSMIIYKKLYISKTDSLSLYNINVNTYKYKTKTEISSSS